MKKILFLGVLCFYSLGNAQNLTSFSILNIGYNNLNGNYLEFGYDNYLVTDSNNIIDLGASINLAYLEEEFIVIPEFLVGYIFNFDRDKSKLDPYSEEVHSAFYTIRMNISPNHFTPEFGVSLFSLIELTAGWGFEFNSHNTAHLSGLKMGVNLKVPTVIF